MRWQAEVWRFTIAGKSCRGNWYEGKFRWLWTAYIAARVMAVVCDLLTPEEWPLGIRWGVRDMQEVK